MTKKSLPTLKGPTLNCVLPVSNTKVKFRPFTVKEQKSLMLANETRDSVVIYDTIRELILACTFGVVDTDNTPSADVAYFFVQLRIQSVGAELRFSMKCEHCGEEVIINYSLESLSVDMKNYSDTIMLDETTGMKFRIPSLADAHDLDTSSIDSVLKLLHNILNIVFDEEQVYEKADYTFDEFKDWVESFNDEQLEKILTWVSNIPELRHELNFTCNHCKQHNRRLLEGLHAFFRFGDDS